MKNVDKIEGEVSEMHFGSEQNMTIFIPANSTYSGGQRFVCNEVHKSKNCALLALFMNRITNLCRVHVDA